MGNRLRGAALALLLLAGGRAAPLIVGGRAAQAGAETTAAEAAAVAESTTAANADPAYRALLDEEHRDLLRSLSGSEKRLSQQVIDRARQTSSQAKAFWKNGSGYAFQVDVNQQADIALLSAFTSLPRPAMERNAAIAAAINLAASPAQQDHAIFDADAPAFLFFLAEALGPKLGSAFLRAYAAGEINRAAALIKASEIGTGAAKAHFAHPRPFAVAGNTIRLVPDRVVAGDGVPYSAYGQAFPSGHAMIGTTDALLLALMLPERFDALLVRADGYGYSRVVLGVHYPLDVIGSRMIAERNVAHFMADERYRSLFAAARDELRTALETRCGERLGLCAAHRPQGRIDLGGNPDPWDDGAHQNAFHRFTLTYGLPRSGATDGPLLVPEGAEVLLETLRPDLSAVERRDLLARTALPSGYPLDTDDRSGSWQRLDLYRAALAAGEIESVR